GAGSTAIVKGHRDGPVRPGSDLRLELVGRLPRRVHVVVDRHRRRPGEPAVGGLGELDVHLGAVPVLVGHVQVPRVGRAGGKALRDPQPEGGVGQAVNGEGRGTDKRAPVHAIVGGAGDKHAGWPRAVYRLRLIAEVDVPGGIDGRVAAAVYRPGLR